MISLLEIHLPSCLELGSHQSSRSPFLDNIVPSRDLETLVGTGKVLPMAESRHCQVYL